MPPRRNNIQDNIRRKKEREAFMYEDAGLPVPTAAPKRKRKDLGSAFIPPTARPAPASNAYLPPLTASSSSAAAYPAYPRQYDLPTSAGYAASGQPYFMPQVIIPAYPGPSQYPTPLQIPHASGSQVQHHYAAAPVAPMQAEKPKKKRKTAAEKAAEPEVEERPAKFRIRAPKTTMERAQRVMSQRMFMVDRERIRDGEMPAERFAVLGSTGNVYNVTIDFNPLCDCPDCTKGNVPCKHIVFVFLKVLKMPVSTTIWYQKGLTNSELKTVFAQAPPDPSDPHVAPAATRAAYLTATGRGEKAELVAAEPDVVVPDKKKPKAEAVGEDCAVCYEEMTQADLTGNKLVFDESEKGCGGGLHRECFQMWAQTARTQQQVLTCVYCRSPWEEAGGGTGKGKAAGGPAFSSNGYMNMADIAGINRERDTSSYYQGPMAGVPMWQLKHGYGRD